MRGLAYFLGIAAGFGLTLQIGHEFAAAHGAAEREQRGADQFPRRHAWRSSACCSPPAHRCRHAIRWRRCRLWAWFGGLIGAFYVAISTVVASQLGTASLLGLALAGQLAMALVVDHFGWLGLPEHPITWLAFRASPCWARVSG